jgi:hypothetical protein
MSDNGPKNGKRSRARSLIPALLIIIVTLSSSAGCIDKGIAHSLADFIEGDDGPDYVWEPLLDKKGDFELRSETNTDPDYVRIATKIGENLTNYDPTQTPLNLKKVMNEENISMVKESFTFYVVQGTKNLNIEVTGTFKTSVGENGPSGGYMEITIIKPDGTSETMEIAQLFTETKSYTYPQEPMDGTWKIELQGLGLQSPFNLIYSGEYEVLVRAEMPKE